MHNELIIAGFGGQGVLLAGKILSQAALIEGKHVTYFPSYGAEIRGGTANCTVIVSDERIDSPVTSEPGAVIAFNNPSVERFEASLVPDGLLLMNGSMVDRVPDRSDLQTFYIPAGEIARELGDERVLNVIMLGAYAGRSGVVSLDALESALRKFLAGKRAAVFEINQKALLAGVESVSE